MSTAMADTDEQTPPAAASTRRARLGLIVVGVALLALLAGLLLGRGWDTGIADVDDEVSIGFLQDMKVHHAQAVEMSEPVHRRSSDPELNYLAFDIMTTQQGQIGLMTGWLDLWGERQSPAGETMAWMGHEGPMPGLATREELASLDTLPVEEMEVEYLRLMLDHHRGALDMAKAALDHAESVDVANLAEGMYRGQAEEIRLMERMLEQRGVAIPVGGEHEDH